MSLFKYYTPKVLYYSTLQMVNTLFVHPPTMDLNPTSYFTAVLKAHQWIKQDLGSVIEPQVATSKDTTLEQIHSSLKSLETMLFGTEANYECTIKGCCLYTDELESRLKSHNHCVVA